MQRSSSSHKGENGKVAIIGGSRHMHGAPLFAALAAEKTGVDLVYVCIPSCHEEVAKNASLNFQVHSFQGDDLRAEDREPILELLATMDTAVIGPGITRMGENIPAVGDIVAEATCPLVIDATALQPDTLEKIRGKNAILTPHLGELKRMGIAEDDLSDAASTAGATILFKGITDRIFTAEGEEEEISGGNAGLTIGGSGDALAGIIAGLIAQGEEHVAACELASTIIKKAGEKLFQELGYTYTTTDVIAQIPSFVTHD